MRIVCIRTSRGATHAWYTGPDALHDEERSAGGAERMAVLYVRRARQPPPADKGRPVRLRYITQAKSRPPTFVSFSSRGHAVPESYQRYLANSLRETFALDGIPLRIFIRKGKNPYEDK